MSQSGKSSIKRGKPSYFMSILGVTLVLLLLGIIGFLIITANKVGASWKESVEVKVELRGDMNPKDSAALMTYIGSKPYVKSTEYVTKEQGKQIMVGEGEKDWDHILDYNPLPNLIVFKMKQEYVHPDTLASIKADLKNQTFVVDVQDQQALVSKLGIIRKISIWLLVIAIILALIVIILIDNTIRLAMFSNRFLIKTMQMVGATRWFIAKPMDKRAILNGAISGIVAVAGVWVLIFFAEKYIPQMKAIHDNTSLILLFAGIIVLGICITLLSTHRSVLKYLRMKLDDLY